MAEYLANGEQSIALNSPIVFNASIPCPRGNVYHEDGTGIFILRGNVANQCAKYATYQVVYNGNISIPTDGAVTPIAVAITLSGEQRPTSRAIYTPTAVETYGNVTSTAIVKIPRGCCFGLSVEYVSGTDDPTVTPTPLINVINSNLTITRIA